MFDEGGDAYTEEILRGVEVLVDVALPVEFSGLEVHGGEDAFSAEGVDVVFVDSGGSAWTAVIVVAICVVGGVSELPEGFFAVDGVDTFDDFFVFDAVEDDEFAVGDDGVAVGFADGSRPEYGGAFVGPVEKETGFV